MITSPLSSDSMLLFFFLPLLADHFSPHLRVAITPGQLYKTRFISLVLAYDWPGSLFERQSYFLISFVAPLTYAHVGLVLITLRKRETDG